MKETTGELNLTIVVVIAVAILVAFFYYTIWPGLDRNFKANSSCSKAVCLLPDECKNAHNNACDEVIDKLVKCKYKDERGNEQEIYCPWKG